MKLWFVSNALGFGTQKREAANAVEQKMKDFGDL